MKVQREKYTMEAHEFKHRAAGKLYCTYCGLMALNNEFTQWSIRMGCNHRDHPAYESKRYDLTKLPI